MQTILVVEDSNTQRVMMKGLLECAGYNVMEAVDGIEAVEILETWDIDLVVLDIIIPKLNGYEVCRKIKGDIKTQDIPVVMCSVKKEQFDIYWGKKQGADEYMPKPFRPEELVETIRRLLPKPDRLNFSNVVRLKRKNANATA